MVMIVRPTFLLYQFFVFEMKDYRLPQGTKTVNHCLGHMGRGSRIGQLTINTYKISMINKQNGLLICDKIQYTLSGYQNHMLMHGEDAKKKVCEQCSSCFLYQSQLDCHMVTHLDEKPYKCPSKACNGKGFKKLH